MTFRPGDSVQINPLCTKNLTASQWNLLGKIGKVTSVRDTTVAVMFEKLKISRVFHTVDLMKADVK